MRSKVFNSLLECFVFVFEIGVVIVQIGYIVLMWSYWILGYLCKLFYQKAFEFRQNNTNIQNK